MVEQTDDKRIVGRAKRRREQAEQSGESILATAAGTESGTESGTKSGTSSGRNNGWWNTGNASERRNSRTNSKERTSEQSGKEETTSNDVQAPKASVENTDSKPKRTSNRTSTSKATTTKKPDAVFGPADVERFLVFSFGMIANINGREWWKVDKKEVESFSPQAADLMNRFLGEHAGKAKEGSEFLAVGFGIMGLVMVRMQKDKAYVQQVTEQMQAESHNYDIYTGEPYKSEPANGHSREALIGAKATSPLDPIFGNGGVL
jgi:hypothetical protein